MFVARFPLLYLLHSCLYPEILLVWGKYIFVTSERQFSGLISAPECPVFFGLSHFAERCSDIRLKSSLHQEVYLVVIKMIIGCCFFQRPKMELNNHLVRHLAFIVDEPRQRDSKCFVQVYTDKRVVYWQKE